MRHLVSPLTAAAVLSAAVLHAAEPSAAVLNRPSPYETRTTEVRAVTLRELIEMAVQNNLDIQFDRYAPEFAYNEVRVAEAGFEPNFNFGYTRGYSEQGGQGFNPNTGLPTLGSEADTESLNGGIGGRFPYAGMQYNLTMTARQDDGANAGGPFQNATGNLRLNITQPLLQNLWIDQTRLNIAQAKNRWKFSEYTLTQQVINTISQVENAYYDLLFTRESRS